MLIAGLTTVMAANSIMAYLFLNNSIGMTTAACTHIRWGENTVWNGETFSMEREMINERHHHQHSASRILVLHMGTPEWEFNLLVCIAIGIGSQSSVD